MNNSLLSISSICKAFDNQQALDHVSIDIKPGEIVGLVGANGAGKSTLLKIISGTIIPDSGKIFFDGAEIIKNSPRSAKEKGIISVYQDLNLFSYLTVAENIFIDQHYLSRIGMINWKSTKNAAQQILSNYGLDVPADAHVNNISYAKQCMVDIVRALNEEPRLLLLDEPTSALCDSEIEWLYEKMREEANKNGTAIIFISHRLEEVSEVCDRNIILRDGKIAHISEGKLDKSTTIKYMVGHDVILDKQVRTKSNENIVFECDGLKSKNGAEAESVCLRKGEILGVAGLVGSGRTELLNSLFGIDRIHAGKIKKDGQEIHINSPSDAIRRGIILIPEDRKLSGLFLEESTRFNIASSTLDKRVSIGMVNEKQEIEQTTEVSRRVMLDTSRLEHLVKQLSGGNQQKVVIARTLLAEADIYLLDEPTRGVDIGAREEIYEIIKNLAAIGKSIILVTSDWEELIYLCDRTLVMSEMKVVGEIEGSISQVAIMHMIEDSIKIECSNDNEDKKGILNIFGGFFGNNNINFFVLFFLLLVVMTLGALLSPFFLKWANISNLFGQSLPLIILSLGQLVVIMSGGIDISSGALMAASAMVGQMLMVNNDFPVVAGIITIIVFSGSIGFINSFIIQKAKVDAFIVTIGMMLVLEGIALVISPRPLGPSPVFFIRVFNGYVFGLPIALIFLLILITLFSILISYTKLGRRFFAIGENPQKSYIVGINVDRTKYISYIISSLMAGLSGIYALGRFGGADPVLGPGLELSAIAAVLVGGATLAGGKGSVVGAICGVFVLMILENLFSLMSVNVWYQHVIEGVVLLSIIASYERAARSKKK